MSKFVTILMLVIISGCSHHYFIEMDKSTLNSELLNNEDLKALSELAPHTNLRGSAAGTTGCSVCAK